MERGKGYLACSKQAFPAAKIEIDQEAFRRMMKQKPWDLIVKPSTRKFFREGRRTAGYSFSNFLHGYIYGRWTYLYIGIGTGEHPLAKKFRPTVNRLSALFERYFRSNNGEEGEGRTFLWFTRHPSRCS